MKGDSVVIQNDDLESGQLVPQARSSSRSKELKRSGFGSLILVLSWGIRSSKDQHLFCIKTICSYSIKCNLEINAQHYDYARETRSTSHIPSRRIQVLWFHIILQVQVDFSTPNKHFPVIWNGITGSKSNCSVLILIHSMLQIYWRGECGKR